MIVVEHQSHPQPAASFGYRISQDIPGLADMPLLAEFVDQHRAKQPLTGVVGLFIQHQLGNQAPMTEALIALGLDPEQIVWLDVPYTSNSRVRHHLTDLCGIPEENFWIHRYRVLDPYPSYQRRRVQELVRNRLQRQSDRVVVLDDGAYFIEAAATFKKRLRNLAIVEQTTRGVIKIQENAALHRYAQTVPVVNVAGSTPKLDLESPWIGVAVVSALQHHLDAVAAQRKEYRLAKSSQALVLGYGTIGQQVARFLRDRHAVRVFDPLKDVADQARADGFLIWDRQKSDERFGLVVGCSGRSSFGVGDYVFLDDHAVLASASSGSVEFSRSDFIDLAASSRIDDIWIDEEGLHEDEIHRPMFMELVDRRAAFLNSGFPINFDGRINCVPAPYMQPTSLLMVQGMLQAARTDETGCVQLDPDFCARLDQAFRKSLKADEVALLPQTPTPVPRECWTE